MAFDTMQCACTGSRWLGDNPSLGRCTCVTPERMRALDSIVKVTNAALEDACEPWKVVETYARMDEPTQDEAFNTLLEKEQASVIAAIRRKTDVLDRDEVRDLVEDVLVSLGLPATPAGALDNPALERLVSFVTV